MRQGSLHMVREHARLERTVGVIVITDCGRDGIGSIRIAEGVLSCILGSVEGQGGVIHGFLEQLALV
jgi:hypothetical protein